MDKASYKKVKYAVFGIGNSAYGKNFNAAGKEFDKILQRLSAQRLVNFGSGDNGAGEEISETFDNWTPQLWSAIKNSNINTKISEEPDEDPEDKTEQEPLVDLEDLGTMMKSSDSSKLAKKKYIKKRVQQRKTKPEAPLFEQKEDTKEKNHSDADSTDSDEEEEEEESETPNGTSVVPKEMLTPSLRKALTKQGYRLLGSHSGVKMCRWTKSMLRGKGGCYKHSLFLFINLKFIFIRQHFMEFRAHRCMEMTPSLACANKCVFCWRHHKNPVGTEWKWKVDAPEDLFEEAQKNHYSLVKQMKGVPGVSKERFEEAFTIRHCALSLVGEPITYVQH